MAEAQSDTGKRGWACADGLECRTLRGMLRPGPHYAKHPHPASGFAVVGVAAVVTVAGGILSTYTDTVWEWDPQYWALWSW